MKKLMFLSRIIAAIRSPRSIYGDGRYVPLKTKSRSTLAGTPLFSCAR